ncbi:conserved hypothetical protein [Nostocoides japonicum T1-X7]|uniref:TIGR02453 family protein n=1 Tax=Nostocoides japonicum T1-X7 TaxID=1194083 RepID=A0A077LTI2_9MICO|nr:DUF2461 domain-containing protein [Tetrasphaera japonica]CCH76843.1 conserved hypothetical protein [Tetrasphaera japonica T1-X7]
MPFDGIPFAALDFYEDLEADNSRTWWLEHKHVYDEQVRAPIEALGAELEDEFGPAKVFRPYRDVRFAKDKTPYKTHQGAWFGESHRYLHVSAAGLFVAGGYWHMSSAQVGRLRRAVADDVAGAALETALADRAVRRLEVGGEMLTRVPSGFDKNHPRADLLRRKALTVGRDLGFPAWLPTRRTLTEVRRQWRAMEPVVVWLDQHVGED